MVGAAVVTVWSPQVQYSVLVQDFVGDEQETDQVLEVVMLLMRGRSQ